MNKHSYDEVQTLFMGFAGLDTSNLVASIDANEVAIAQARVVQHSYTAPALTTASSQTTRSTG